METLAPHTPASNPALDLAAGSNVVDANNPSRVGITTGRVRNLGATTLIEVAWGPQEREYVPAPLLKLFTSAHATIESKIEAGEFGGAEDLRRLITFEKLKGSLNDFIYSMEAAGINFLEYQFKPVLKFIESPTERLLIADEVGLGKTIESALIWLELRARRDARRLLVVCPKMIARKWRKDLREKFNVPAEIADFSQLRSSFADFKREGNSLRFAWICTYSGLRPNKEDMLHLEDADYKFTERGRFVRDLNEFNSEVPFFDLVICDEAHYMRNSASAQSKLGTALGKVTAALLLVSATPVNNSNRDLFTLLRLLDPDFFENNRLFQALLEENRPAVQALNALSCVPPNIEQARACVQELAGSSFVGSSELLARLRDNLAHLQTSDTSALVSAQEMAERLNILGSYVTRMRRAQVKERPAVRDPHVVPVTLTSTEQKFYAAVTRMVRMNVAKAGKVFSAFHLVMPQQRMASCIPAMVKAYHSGQLGDLEELLAESFDIGEDSYTDDQIEGASQSLDELLQEFRTYDFEANDSKYGILRKQLLENLGSEKVIIFSYFRGTLEYLNRRLEADGIGCAVIHGGMLDQDDREDEIDRFRSNPGVRVLLSSEVGSEGIDLQFCHVLVNYDLPWNPMRIEQRIGRIDRVGQEADRLIIIHFRILDTIEDRLFTRLHEKLLRFENSIGDLEPIIGREIQDLTLDLMRQELTPEQEEARIMQTERVLTQRLEDTRRLEESGESLLAHADYISSQVNRDRDLGRYVSPEELRQYIDDFLANNFPGCRLQWDHPIQGTFRLELTWQAHDSLTDYLHAQKLEAPPELQARIITGTLIPDLARTRPTVNQRRLVLINHLSPLIRWITGQNQQREGAFYNVSALRVCLNSLPAGVYAYRIERWRLKGLRVREVLSYACAPVGGCAMEPKEAEHTLHQVLKQAETWRHPEPPGADTHACLEMLRDSLQDRFEALHDEFSIRNSTLASVQRARIENHFNRRREIDERRIATMIERGRTENMIKLVQRQMDNDTELAAKRTRDLERKSEINCNFQEVAAGIIHIEKL
jgi:superfamily II DNA or RNA helicase